MDTEKIERKRGYKFIVRIEWKEKCDSAAVASCHAFESRDEFEVMKRQWKGKKEGRRLKVNQVQNTVKVSTISSGILTSILQDSWGNFARFCSISCCYADDSQLKNLLQKRRGQKENRKLQQNCKDPPSGSWRCLSFPLTSFTILVTTSTSATKQDKKTRKRSHSKVDKKSKKLSFW